MRQNKMDLQAKSAALEGVRQYGTVKCVMQRYTAFGTNLLMHAVDGALHGNQFCVG